MAFTAWIAHRPQASPTEVLRTKSAWALPLIAKPRDGSGSIGVRLIVSWQELELLEAANEDCIVQEKANGHEFTINVYVSREGECVCKAHRSARRRSLEGHHGKGLPAYIARAPHC
jgi:glutathione synthase/RimK-type ligase-like ATP-grasp enzyme